MSSTENKSLAASGHRPDKLFKSDPYSYSNFKLLTKFANNYLSNRPDCNCIISGMALGWDQCWAFAGLQLGITVKAYVPCKNQQSNWPYMSRKLYETLMEQIKPENVKVISKTYTSTCMQERNEAMSDDCDESVVLWNGTSGGTKNFIDYHKRKRLINLWDSWILFRDK